MSEPAGRETAEGYGVARHAWLYEVLGLPKRGIAAAQVIEELNQLAKEMKAAGARGEALGLDEDELAFYDALETNDSAVKVLSDDTLRQISRELVETV